MRIRVEAIEAEIINQSTPTYDDAIIRCWKVKYSVEFTGGPPHRIEGEMAWLKIPDVREILDFIRKRYAEL